MRRPVSVALAVPVSLLAFLFLALPSRAALLRVDIAAAGTVQDGTTWATAYRSVPSALAASQAGDEVWVAKGVYAGPVTLVAGVAVYGGFSGTESDRSARDWRANATVLEAASAGSVVSVAPGSESDTVLDGFTLQRGSGTTVDTTRRGGGIYAVNASPTIRNVTVRYCDAQEGGGVYWTGGAPVLENVFLDNNSATLGGGIYAGTGGAGSVRNLRALRNRSDEGAALYLDAASPTISNATLTGNYPNSTNPDDPTYGAGIRIRAGAAPVFVNCIITRGGVVRNDESAPGAPVFRNCCIYSLQVTNQPFYGMPSPIGQDGNIEADPLLVSEPHGNLHIQPDSPCRNAGSTADVWTDATDMDGQHRAQDASVDIGADESDGTRWVEPARIYHVSTTGSSLNDGLSWTTAKRIIYNTAQQSAAGDEIRVAEGTYLESNISLPAGVGLYGGFAGTETRPEDRNLAAHQTVIQTSTQCILTGGAGATVVDGFHLQLRPISSGTIIGRAIYCYDSTAVIRNNIISSFVGPPGYSGSSGYAAVTVQGGAPVIRDNVFRSNRATRGGAVWASASDVRILNNAFLENVATASAFEGGAVYCSGGHPVIAGNTFFGNTAQNGAALLLSQTGGTVTGNTFASNFSSNGTVRLVGGTNTLENNIVAMNSTGVSADAAATLTLRANCVFGNTDGNFIGVTDPTGANGNISLDPRLADARLGDLHIQPNSPCINAGDGTAPEQTATDMDGQSRVQGGMVDIGADESDGTAWPQTAPRIVRVKTDGDDLRDGAAWENAKKTLQAAADAAGPGGEVWVAAGTYLDPVTVTRSTSLYGGFAGTETFREQRSPAANVTALDGRGRAAVRVLGAHTGTVDGFSILRGGYAVPFNMVMGYGGIVCDGSAPTLSNNIFTTTTSSGVDALNGARPVIERNTFSAATSEAAVRLTGAYAVVRGNTVTSGRKGVYLLTGSGALVLGNVLSGSTEQGVYADVNSSVTIANNVFLRNATGVLLYGAGRVVNNTFVQTTSISIRLTTAQPTVANNIVYMGGTAIMAQNGTAIRRNCLYGNVPYSGFSYPAGQDPNVLANPKLASVPDGNFHIQPDSPCRDAGDDSLADAAWTDMDGQPRIQGAHVDIGADESDGSAYLPYVVRVKPDGDDAARGDTWATARRTISAAVNAVSAARGGEVWVAAGTYTGSVSMAGGAEVYGGFAGTEMTRDQRDTQRNVTALEGSGSNTVVNDTTGVTGPWVLDGFTIRKGASGVSVLKDSPTIRNCVLTANTTGIYCGTGTAPLIDGNSIVENTGTGIRSLNASPVIQGNTIRGNHGYTSGSVPNGGGLYVIGGAPVITNNAITDNTMPSGGEYPTSTPYGGGLYLSGSAARVENNVFARNGAFYGGGIALQGMTITPVIRGNVFLSNAATYGGAVYANQASATFVNNTLADNSAISAGGAFDVVGGSSVTLTNNIVAFNSSGLFTTSGTNNPASTITVRANDLFGNTAYDVKGLADPAGTDGNIHADPSFADAEHGRWHIRPDSPCRDTGVNDAVPDGSLDIDGQPRIQNGTVDMGADESDGTVPSVEIRIVRVRPDGDDANDGATWAAAKRTVQGGIDALSEGGEVWVAAGTYMEAVRLKPFVGLFGGFRGDETLRAARDWRANQTVIDAGARSTVVNAIGISRGAVDGFTLRNGATRNYPTTDWMRPVGGGVSAFLSGIRIENNTITQNRGDLGGGVFVDGPVIVRNNVITRNSAQYGGGVYVAPRSEARVANNVLSDNGAYTGSGLFLNNGAGAAVNNTIAYGSQAYAGAAVYIGQPSGYPLSGPAIPVLVANNIVAYNPVGIGVGPGHVATLHANDVYGNTGAAYSGVTDPTGTDGNLQVDPHFADAPPGFLHIRSDSLCRNAGDNTSVLPGEVDMDGQPRIQDGRVDIGADESDGTLWTYSPRIIRVHPDGNDAGDGSSWAAAKRTVQAALDAAALTGGEVWVAAGTYPESVTLAHYVTLYGGFAGTETARTARNPSLYRTLLDAPARSTAVSIPTGATHTGIDGFTIRHSIAPVDVTDLALGSAIVCSPRSSARIASNVILGHSGGYGAVQASYAEATLEGNVIAGNRVSTEGSIPSYGTVYAARSVLTMRNNLVSGNEGPGVYLNASTATLTGNTIVANSSAGIAWTASAAANDPVLANNIVAYNGIGLWRTSGTSALTSVRSNCLWGNVSAAVTGLDDPTGTNGNIAADPHFASIDYGDFHLQPGSPCIDAGSDTDAAGTDMDVQSRIQGLATDIGADESDGSARMVVPRIVRVRPDGDDRGDGSTWVKAKRTVRAAMMDLALHGGEAWVAAGTYMERVPMGPFASLYGGFTGTEVSREARVASAPDTVLDGGYNGAVLSVPFSLRPLTVDRLTIRNGAENLGSSEIAPAGLRAKAAVLTVSHNVIEDNFGHAVWLGANAVVVSNTITRNRVGLYTGAGARIENNLVTGNSGYGIGTGDGALILGNTVENNAGPGLSTGAGSQVLLNRIRGNVASYFIAAGVNALSPGAVIAGNEITGNRGDYGGGVNCGDGVTVSGNLIAYNRAADGAGIYTGGSPTIENNLILGNSLGDGAGIAAYDGAPVIRGNVIAGNQSAGWSSGRGGGIYLSSSAATVVNNTIAGNHAHFEGGSLWISGGAPVLHNNIIAFGNSGVYVSPTDSHGVPVTGVPAAFRNNLVYSNGAYDFKGMADPTGTNGNLRADPKLAGLSFADVHIQPDSPARDAGDNAALAGATTDFEDDPRIQGARVDIGADESDGSVRLVVPRVVTVRPGGDDTRDGSDWANAKATVQAGVDALAETGGEVWVAAGTYTGPITLRPYVYLYGGFAGTETAREARSVKANPTVLDGQGAFGHVVSALETGISGGIDGFVIRGGMEKYSATGSLEATGGGIFCRSASPVIRNNDITGNVGSGIMLQSSAPLIESNVIHDNASRGSGIGLYAYIQSSPTVLRNVFRANRASDSTAYSSGGGIWMDITGSRIADNLFVGNTAGYGAAVTLSSFWGTLANNTIVDNTAAVDGGGVLLSPAYYATPRILNNIIACNTSGMLVTSSGIESATLEQGNLFYANAAYDRSGIAPASGSTPPLIADPLFVDRANGDYRLNSASPGVNAGVDSAVMPGDLDLDGQPRTVGPHTDIGAYEYGAGAFGLPDILRALQIAGGLRAYETYDQRLDLSGVQAADGIDLLDAARIARKAAGLDTNP